ncbi:MAG: D-alanyl-D-alanine carboxypeptidase family protein [Candidatus Dormibacteria bacterium]
MVVLLAAAVLGTGLLVNHRVIHPRAASLVTRHDLAGSTGHPAIPSVSASGRPAVVPAKALATAPFSWDYRWAALHRGGEPRVHARAAIVVDLDTNRVLYSLNPHLALPMASTTKLMTAMVTLDNVDPDAVLTVPESAVHVEPNVMGLGAGERVSVHDLLYGLLLDSGNDAAETLADGTLGRDRFIAAMNRKAAVMGLTDSHFSNPSGLDSPGHQTSAHDLALMAAALYREYPLLATVVSTREQPIPGDSGHKAFDPINLDKMLWTYRGAIGFKTGLTDAAGNCLVTGAHRGTHTLVAVVLNDPVMFTDGTTLLDYGFRRAA